MPPRRKGQKVAAPTAADSGAGATAEAVAPAGSRGAAGRAARPAAAPEGAEAAPAKRGAKRKAAAALAAAAAAGAEDEAAPAERSAEAAPVAAAGIDKAAPTKRRAKRKAAAAATAAAEAAPAKSGAKRRATAAPAVAAAGAEAAPASAAAAPLLEPLPKKAGAKAAEGAAGNTVFVDGVPYTWDLEKIRSLFGRCGEVLEVRAPSWQDTGRLRGYAHVSFAERKARDEALKMDGIKVGAKGRYLKIEAAKATDDAPAPAATAKDLAGKRRLFAKNLPYDATEAEIRQLFGVFGRIVDVRVPTSFGRCKGFAYVEFVQAEALLKAIAAGAELKGRRLQLDADSGAGPKAGFHYRPEAYAAAPGGSRRGGGGGGEPGRAPARGRGQHKLPLL